MILDLGGIAKGYACDKGIAALKDAGITRALVDTGGGMALSDPPPDKPAWRIGMLGDDSKILLLSNCGVSTSGDIEQVVEIGGGPHSPTTHPPPRPRLTHTPTRPPVSP